MTTTETAAPSPSPSPSPSAAALAAVRAWVVDVDGCLMRTERAGGAGGRAMPRAGDLIAALADAGHAVVVCTNASQLPPAQYAAHLRAEGIPVADDDFETAGSAAAAHVAAHHPGARVVAVGDTGITDPLRRLGVDLVGPGGPVGDVVLVGAASTYTSEEINAACLAVDAGAPLYTTVATPWFHGGLGKSVAISSAIAQAVAWATGVRPTVLGKPSESLAQTLLRRLPEPPERIAVVGDAPAEIRLARLMGALSVLVLSGGTTERHLAGFTGDGRPDVVLPDVEALYDLLS